MPENATDGALAGILGAHFAEQSTRQLAAATNGVFHDSAQLQRVIDQYANCNIGQTQGRAFEFLEVLKFNRAAARQGADLKAIATHYTNAGSRADIVIQRGKEVLRQAQAKSYKDASGALHKLAKTRGGEVYYDGMQRLVPRDRLEGVAELLDKRLKKLPADSLKRPAYEDVKRNLSGTLLHDGVTSGGTTRAEAEFAVNHPRLSQIQLCGSAALEEVGTAGLKGAMAGGAVAGGFRLLSNAYALHTGKRSPNEAVIDVITGTAGAAVRGGVVSLGSKAIVIAARENGLRSFTQSAAPVAIANTVFEVAQATTRYLRGEINDEEYRDEAGGVLVRASATFYCGLAGQMLIPIPVVGGVVGSLAGYAAAAILVQSGVLGIGANNIVKIAEDRRRTVEAETYRAIVRMDALRREIQDLSAAYNIQFTETILPCLDRLDQQLARWEPEAIVGSLGALNTAIGTALPWRSFAEFEDFMLDDNAVFEL